MSMKCLGTLVVALLTATAAHAQKPGQTAPPPQEKPPTAQAKAAPSEAPPPGQLVNIKVEVTITDQMGPREPARKTVSLIVADRSAGSVRSAGNNIRAILNVDATPQILSNGNIKVQLGLDYNPRQSMDKVEAASVDVSAGSALTQRVSIVLVPGKPLIMSQAADPISDRKITVEVRAEILK
jgi:glucose/arabinose dehydrogenase